MSPAGPRGRGLSGQEPRRTPRYHGYPSWGQMEDSSHCWLHFSNCTKDECGGRTFYKEHLVRISPERSKCRQKWKRTTLPVEGECVRPSSFKGRLLAFCPGEHRKVHAILAERWPGTECLRKQAAQGLHHSSRGAEGRHQTGAQMRFIATLTKQKLVK